MPLMIFSKVVYPAGSPVSSFFRIYWSWQ